jgi:hypothetical protein
MLTKASSFFRAEIIEFDLFLLNPTIASLLLLGKILLVLLLSCLADTRLIFVGAGDFLGAAITPRMRLIATPA